MSLTLVRPLVLGCLLGALALLLETGIVSDMLSNSVQGMLVMDMIGFDLSRLEKGLLRAAAMQDFIQLRQVAGISFILCAGPLYLAAGAMRLAPIRTALLGVASILVCAVHVPVLLARINMAFWGIHWQEIPIKRLAYYVNQGHLVMPIRIPDILILPLGMLPYLVPIPAVGLVVLGVGRLVCSRNG